MLKLAIKAMIEMLRSYASALNNVADVEERSGKRFDEVIRDMFSPATLSTLYEMLPSDVYGELMGTFFKHSLSTHYSTGSYGSFSRPEEKGIL
jgi:hypothetical protein